MPRQRHLQRNGPAGAGARPAPPAGGGTPLRPSPAAPPITPPGECHGGGCPGRPLPPPPLPSRPPPAAAPEGPVPVPVPEPVPEPEPPRPGVERSPGHRQPRAPAPSGTEEEEEEEEEEAARRKARNNFPKQTPRRRPSRRRTKAGGDLRARGTSRATELCVPRRGCAPGAPLPAPLPAGRGTNSLPGGRSPITRPAAAGPDFALSPGWRGLSAVPARPGCPGAAPAAHPHPQGRRSRVALPPPPLPPQDNKPEENF
ncbi:basic proline-rich protein-like [Lathamus discolor]|uniref:basic proline-rich protein-like n=1 Tax=Lathamus discolor TaxID=678569 RepID=UPI0032B7D273